MKIIPVDCNYVEPGFAASYLLVKEGTGLFVECNTNFAIPFLLEAAKAEGLSPDDIKGLIITHVHLDHAGGAGLFLKTFPHAILYSHPRAARHAIDPSKLIASATAVYGERFMEECYGKILPCDAARVRVLEDGVGVDFAGVELQTKHVRGHANHHLVVFEPTTRTLFTGDSCGVTYPKINQKHAPENTWVVLASTSPTDFEGEAALASIDWIEALAPDRLAPTHFGFIPRDHHARTFQMLRDQIRFSMDLLQRIRSEKLLESEVIEILRDWLIQYFKSDGIEFDRADLELLAIDIKVNSQGLIFAANRSAAY